MNFDIESGSIVVAIISIFLLGFGFWIIKKMEDL